MPHSRFTRKSSAELPSSRVLPTKQGVPPFFIETLEMTVKLVNQQFQHWWCLKQNFHELPRSSKHSKLNNLPQLFRSSMVSSEMQTLLIPAPIL